MAKDPAFLFYSADFMMGTLLMSMEEKGQYITLLSVMHQQGRLSVEEIEVVIKSKPSAKLASKFKIDDNGKWYNERLEVEALKRQKFTESRRNSLDIDNDDMVHIYLLFDPITGNYKIGSSKYPMLRFAEMQKKNPEVSLHWKSSALVTRKTEKELHNEFKNKKIKNDWFALNGNDLNNIINKNYFCTDTLIEYRTDHRTVNENENENENTAIVLSYKKESEPAQVHETPIEVYPAAVIWQDEVCREHLQRLAKTYKVPDVDNLLHRWEGWYMSKFEWTKKGLNEYRKSFEGWIIDPKSRQQAVKATIDQVAERKRKFEQS